MSHATAGTTDSADNSGDLPVDLSAFEVTGEEIDPLTASFSNGDKTVTFIVLLFGAAHGSGVFADLQARDPRWQRMR